MRLAGHIRLCPDTQKFLALTHLVIANVIHLHKNDVKFKCGRGQSEWIIFFKTDRNREEKFAKPQDLWLQSQENVVKFIDSRVVAAPITPSDNSHHSTDDIGRQNTFRNRPSKRKEPEHIGPQNDIEGKGNGRDGKKIRRHNRRPKDDSDRK